MARCGIQTATWGRGYECVEAVFLAGSAISVGEMSVAAIPLAGRQAVHRLDARMALWSYAARWLSQRSGGSRMSRSVGNNEYVLPTNFATTGKDKEA